MYFLLLSICSDRWRGLQFIIRRSLNDRPRANLRSRLHSNSDANQGTFSNLHGPAQMSAWCYMHEISKLTIMVHGAARVQNAMLTDDCSGLHDCARHDDGASADKSIRGDGCRWVYQRNVTGGPPAEGFALAMTVIAHGDHRAFGVERLVYPPTGGNEVADYGGMATVTNQFNHFLCRLRYSRMYAAHCLAWLLRHLAQRRVLPLLLSVVVMTLV